MKLALGTVQFGLRYGIANQQGQVSAGEARAIVDYAAKNGINTLDTAAAYGDSEARLGELGVQAWHIVSKLPPIPRGVDDVEQWVRATVEKSLHLLKVRRLAGLLLHHPADLLGGKGKALERALRDIQEAGLIGKIGVSVYNPKELEELVGPFRIELVQAPFNVLDRRLHNSGWLSQLHDRGVEVHVRSVFLQGLLLFPNAVRPPQFGRWAELWREWEDYLRTSKQTPLEACLRFVSSYPIIARIVVGIDSQRQLEEIVAATVGSPILPPASLMSNDPWLLEPSRWGSLIPATG